MPAQERAGHTPDTSDPEQMAQLSPYHADDASPPPEKPTILRQTAHYAGLVFAAMIGTLIRLGLEALTDCEL